MTLTIDAERIVSRSEMSREGKPWEGDLELTYERI